MSLDHTRISASEEGSLCLIILAGAQEPDSSSN